VSHLLQVAGLVQEHGGDQEQTVAALLHDVLEDCEGVDEAELRSRFGAGVAGMVRQLSDTQPDETPDRKRPWRERKTRYLAELASTPERSVLVSACDKLHNLASLVADLRVEGPLVFERFNAGADEQLWFYASFVDATAERLPERLRLELETRLAELRSLLA
jgi:(p)ppGpp synthase/HD superfamily hydrolase